MTIAEVVRLYLKNLENRVAADDYSYEGAKIAALELNRFAAEYGHQTIAECKQHDVSDWLAAHPRWKSIDTKRRVVSIITSCFNWALHEELIERSPYQRPIVLRGKTANVRRPATPEEYCRLMRAAGRPLRRALFFLRRTGCRTCEMVNLTWDEVFLEGETAYLAIGRHKTFRQSGKPRIVGLDPSTARFLRNLARQYERRCGCACENCIGKVHPHVFTNNRGDPWDSHTFARHLRRTAKAAGVDDGVEKRFSAYCLRHMYTVSAIEAGISTRKIADQLGHAKTAMIDSHYGSHTRHRAKHLSSVADEITKARKKGRTP